VTSATVSSGAMVWVVVGGATARRGVGSWKERASDGVQPEAQLHVVYVVTSATVSSEMWAMVWVVVGGATARRGVGSWMERASDGVALGTSARETLEKVSETSATVSSETALATSVMASWVTGLSVTESSMMESWVTESSVAESSVTPWAAESSETVTAWVAGVMSWVVLVGDAVGDNVRGTSGQNCDELVGGGVVGDGVGDVGDGVYRPFW
jgi:hypothetical protein